MQLLRVSAACFFCDCNVHGNDKISFGAVQGGLEEYPKRTRLPFFNPSNGTCKRLTPDHWGDATYGRLLTLDVCLHIRFITSQAFPHT